MKRDEVRRNEKMLREELRRAFAGKESWERVDGPIGFVYRHQDGHGKAWEVRGIWPSVAVSIAAAAFVVGLLVGLWA